MFVTARFRGFKNSSVIRVFHGNLKPFHFNLGNILDLAIVYPFSFCICLVICCRHHPKQADFDYITREHCISLKLYFVILGFGANLTAVGQLENRERENYKSVSVKTGARPIVFHCAICKQQFQFILAKIFTIRNSTMLHTYSKQLNSMGTLVYFNMIEFDQSTWPATGKFDRSKAQSEQTLSVDRPLFSALQIVQFVSLAPSSLTLCGICSMHTDSASVLYWKVPEGGLWLNCQGGLLAVERISTFLHCHLSCGTYLQYTCNWLN